MACSPHFARVAGAGRALAIATIRKIECGRPVARRDVRKIIFAGAFVAMLSHETYFASCTGNSKLKLNCT
jgi:hypothetical protein